MRRLLIALTMALTLSPTYVLAAGAYDNTRLIVIFGERAGVCSGGGSPYSGIAVLNGSTVEQTILLPNASPENIMLNKSGSVGDFVYISCANAPEAAPYHSYIYHYNSGLLDEPPAEKLSESCLGCHSTFKTIKFIDKKTIRLRVPKNTEAIATLIGNALGSGPPDIIDTQHPRP